MTITINGYSVLDENTGIQNAGNDDDTGIAVGSDDDLAWTSFQSALSSGLYTHLFGTGGTNLGLPSSGTNFPQVAWQSDLISLSSAVDALTLAKDDQGNAFNGVDSGLTDLAGHKIWLFADSDNHVVLGRIATGATADPSGAVAIALVLDDHTNASNQVSTADLYTLQFMALKNPAAGSVDDADTLSLADKVFLNTSLTTHVEYSDFSAVPSGQDNWAIIQPTSTTVTDPDILVTGLTATDRVNVSTLGLGMNSQAVDHNEGLRFDFVNGGRTNLTNAIVHDDSQINYTDHQTGNGGGFSLTQTSPNKTTVSATVHAYDAAGEYKGADFKDHETEGTSLNITSVRVYNGADQLVFQSSVDGVATSDGITIDLSGDTAKIDGLKVNYRVDFSTSADMDRFTVVNVSSQLNRSFDLGKIYLTQTTTTTDHPEVGSHVIFEDAGPTAAALATADSVTHDESAGLQGDDVAGSADTGGSVTIASRFAGVASPVGSDTDVATLDNGAIGFARSGSAIVTASGGGFGADGPATADSATYTLSTASAGGASGVETTDGSNIFLFKEGSLIIGRVGADATAAEHGDAAFAVAVNASTGELYLAQYLSLKHSDPTAANEDTLSPGGVAGLATNAVKVTLTYTDGDGDTAAATKDVSSLVGFRDDAPTVTLSLDGTPSITVDETTLGTAATDAAASLTATTNYGADGPAASDAAVYTLVDPNGADSGLHDVATDSHVLLDKTGSDVVGFVDNNDDKAFDAGDTEIFRVAINTSSGALTLTQSEALKHPDATNPDDSVSIAASVLYAKLQLTDGDGDKASSTTDIGPILHFKDDAPSSFTPAAITATDAVKDQPDQTATKDLTGDATAPGSTTVMADHAGADGFGSLAFWGVNGTQLADGALLHGSIGAGSDRVLQADAKDIHLTGFGTDTLTGYTEGDNIAGYDPAQDKAIFTITLDPASDTYTFTMLDQIDNGASALTLGFAGQKQTVYEFLTLDSPLSGSADPGDPDGDFMFTGMSRTTVGGAITGLPGPDQEINVSSTGIGVSSQSIAPLHGVFIDFVDGAPLTANGQTPITELDSTNFPEHETYNNAGFSVSQLKPNVHTVTDVRVSVYDETNSATSAAQNIVNDTPEHMTQIIVRGSGGDEHLFRFSDGDASATIGGRSVSVDWDPSNGPGGGTNYVEVDNLGEGYTVLASTGDGFQRMLVENVGTGNEGFDISGIRIEQFNGGDPVHMSFDTALADRDGDLAFGTIGMTLTSPDIIA